MVKQETTNTRDLLINNFRRQGLFPQCYMSDVDAVEYRYEHNTIRIAAIIDYKQWSVKDINTSSIKLQYFLSKQLKVPFYIIWYRLFDNEIDFKILNVMSESYLTNYLQYLKFYSQEK